MEDNRKKYNKIVEEYSEVELELLKAFADAACGEGSFEDEWLKENLKHSLPDLHEKCSKKEMYASAVISEAYELIGIDVLSNNGVYPQPEQSKQFREAVGLDLNKEYTTLEKYQAIFDYLVKNYNDL